MEETKLRECPFCGRAESPHNVRKLYDGSWVVSHFCDPEDLVLKISINVYGNTKKEAIERWNRRATDEKAD
jgi:hypothetical protein